MHASHFRALLIGVSVAANSLPAQNWTQTSSPPNPWYAFASSADGGKLVAAAGGSSLGGIYVSSNSGATWTQTPAPITNWFAVATSADGVKLVAVAGGGPAIKGL